MFRSLSSRFWQSRLPPFPTGGLAATWICLSLLLVLLAPSQLLNDLPFWRLGVRAIGQAIFACAAFLGLVAFMATAGSRRGLRVIALPGALLAFYGTPALLLSQRPELLYGWGDFLASGGVGVVLAVLPVWAWKYRPALITAGLFVAASAFAVVGSRFVVTGAPETTTYVTALKPVSVRTYRRLVEVDPRDRGGALENIGDAVLLVTASGDFYHLSTSGDLTARKLALAAPPAPLDRDRDVARLPTSTMLVQRVTDMLVQGNPAQVYIAYQRWDPSGACYTMRVATTALSLDPAPASAGPTSWRQIYESSPCLAYRPNFGPLEAGGRLAWADGSLLLTIGDFNLGEFVKPPPSQLRDNPFGKVLRIHLDGRSEIFTLGHRNPQGLLVDQQGRVWSTEHGPQGGDELNQLQPGANYGYPLASYGTSYGRFVWLVAPEIRNHGAFVEPAQAFLPSIGASNLIDVRSALFPEWEGDLLVASLTRRSLFRIRVRHDRVVYIEPLSIGYRLRDIVEAPDGRILLWTDEGAILAMSPGPAELEGSVVFMRCANCHESPEAGPNQLPLRGLIGRPVGSVSGYPYTEALKKIGGTWTAERLDKFLADPDSFAPGSAMGLGRVMDAKERQALIEFLKTR